MSMPITAPISPNVNVSQRPTLGPVAGGIVLVITFIIGGMYFLGMYLNSHDPVIDINMTEAHTITGDTLPATP